MVKKFEELEEKVTKKSEETIKEVTPGSIVYQFNSCEVGAPPIPCVSLNYNPENKFKRLSEEYNK